MQASTSGAAALIDILLAPRKALQAIQQGKAKLWWPLLLILGSSAALFSWYFGWVNFDWLRGQMIQDALQSGRVTAAESEQMAKFLQPTSMMIGSLAGVLIGIPLVLAVQSLYLLIVEKFAGGQQEQGYGRWFSLAAWSSVPALLGTLASAVAILTTGNRQLSIEQLNVTSFNNLLFKLPPTDPWASLWNSMTPFSLWSIFLIGLGWSQWRNTSLTKGLLVAAIPWLIIWGGMAAFAASR